MSAPPHPPTGGGGGRSDVVVVGGGSIGLATAWTLATRGMAVAVADPDPGRGASWAAAGMLAPVSEVHYGEEPLLALTLAAARRWPDFAARLEAAVGRSVGYRPTGTLVVAADDDDRAWAEELFAFQRDLGLSVQWLSGRDARHLEPGVAPGVRGAIWVADDHQVHTRLLVGALLDAATACGVALHRRRAVSLECQGGAVSGVRLDDGASLRATCVVLAAGCWSGQLEGLPAGAAPPVRPVKGQILRLTPTGATALAGRTVPLERTGRAVLLERTVRAVVGGASVYLVPRHDGSVVVGATVEERGFDTVVTAGAVYELLRDARRVVPGVTEMALQEARAGLRPGTPDNGPLVGRPTVPGVDGLVVATGHYRQGILLTPVTAAAVAAIVTGDDPPQELAPFGPGRFTDAARAGP